MMANQRKFLDHVAKYAAEHNWRLTIPNDGIAPTMWEGDGALVSFSRSREQMNFAKRLSRRATPCVGLSYALPRHRLPRVLVAYERLAQLAAGCLHGNGYAHFIYYSSERLKSSSIAYKAFVRELRALGHSGKVPWLVREEMVEEGRLYDPKSDGIIFRRCFAKAERPLGVWCFSDSLAARLLDSAIAAGESIPDGFGILGSNDNPVMCENQQIPMSSINPDYRSAALKACETLDRAMAGTFIPATPTFIEPLGVSERDTTGTVTGGNPVLRAAFAAMHDHIGEAYGVRELAEDLKMSDRKLDRLFRRKLSTTPAAEMKALRLKTAASLLRTTDFTIEKIATTCGFSHAPHFVNTFRFAYGETPATWRNRWRR